MTSPLDRLSLFEAMDVAADLLRVVELSYCAADDQIIFRRLQKQKQPGLSLEQFQNLFAVWKEHYAAKCEQDRKRALANISAVADEFAKHNPPSKFQCVCGAETDDPLDAEFERIHPPACLLARARSADEVTATAGAGRFRIASA